MSRCSRTFCILVHDLAGFRFAVPSLLVHICETESSMVNRLNQTDPFIPVLRGPDEK